MAPHAAEHVAPGPDSGGRHAYEQPDDRAHIDDGAEPDPIADGQGEPADPPATTTSGPDDHPGAAATWWRGLVAAMADHAPPALRGARWQLSGRAAASVALGLVLAVLVAFVVAGRGRSELISPGMDAVATPSALTAEPTVPGTGSATATADDTVVVHVAGLVAAPGVFELPLGSRVVDALEAAGGANVGVDLSLLNLARVLVDGEQIAVGVPAAPDGAGAGPTGAPSAGEPVDLNRATEAELDALPGVGPVLAGRIVAWREEHGAFSAVEELLEVSGIGTATFAELAPLVRV